LLVGDSDRHPSIGQLEDQPASGRAADAAAGVRRDTVANGSGCRELYGYGNVVEASDLATDTVLNFFVTDAGGKNGRVLGITWSGTWSVTVPDRTSPTTYEFASTTFGKNGSKYRVYASCTADA
jgi:hypothetical protein